MTKKGLDAKRKGKVKVKVKVRVKVRVKVKVKVRVKEKVKGTFLRQDLHPRRVCKNIDRQAGQNKNVIIWKLKSIIMLTKIII